MPVRVLIAENDQELRNELKEIVTHSGYEVAGVARDSQEAIQLVMQFSPHVALISQSLPGVSGLMTCEMLSALSPDVMPVLITDSKSPDVVDGALRSGARAVIAKPVNPNQLAQRIEELADVRGRRDSEEFAQWKDPARFPKIVSVTGARGGVGKSTIAANLAIVLARQQKDAVLLFDLYTQFGDIPSMFNVSPKGTLVDVMPTGEDMDADIIENSVTKHPSGVNILITSNDPMPLDAITNEVMDNLLYVLKRKYRYIIIDAPPMLHHTTLNVLAHSNLILLVANMLDLTTVADTRKFYDAIRQEQIPREVVGVVLNRVARENKIQVEDVERLFECCILARIPNDPRLVDAVNQGIPLAQGDQDSAFIRSITAMSRRITGAADADPSQEETPAKRSIFRLRKQTNES